MGPTDVRRARTYESRHYIARSDGRRLQIIIIEPLYKQLQEAERHSVVAQAHENPSEFQVNINSYRAQSSKRA